MKKIVAVFVLLVTALSIGVLADGPRVLAPTNTQTLQLKVAQLTAILAQKDAVAAQEHAQATMRDFMEIAEKVKADNKWDSATAFDPNTLTFTAPAKEPKK